MSVIDPGRRQFLKSSALVGGGLLVSFSMPSMAGAGRSSAVAEFAPNAFVQITADNEIVFVCPRDEMGQGITTGLGTLIAEELDVEPGRLQVRLPSVDDAFVNPAFGIQGTGGSTSMKVHFLPLRQVGANVRQLIVEAASRDLAVPVSDLSTEDGHVVLNGERFPYGRFTTTASEIELVKDAPLKPASQFKYIGSDFPRLDGMEKATGTAVYGIDVDIPGMHHALVLRSPVAGGTLKSMNGEAAKAMPGVTDVIEISAGVAVVATKFWQAKKAVEKITAEWDLPELAQLDSTLIKADMEQALAAGGGVSTATQGSLEEGFSAAQSVVENEYWAPYLAHAPMEPMNAVVDIRDGEAEVWTGSQGPVGVQGLVARVLGIDKDKVHVHSTYMGGAFGRRGTLSHVVEAAEIAAATNKPIHLLWTREDDLKHGVYRDASLMRIKAGLADDGSISGWEATRVGGNNMPTTLSNQLPALLPGFVPQAAINLMVKVADKAYTDWTVYESSVEGLFEDYDLPNREVRHISKDYGLPLTYWRAVGHSYTAFAKETMMDELATKADMDAVDFRLRNTQNNPRLAQVIRLAGEHASPDRVATGRSVGLAAHGSFDSYVAEVAEVSVENGQIRVHKVTCVVDCGQVVNPDMVRAQMEGAIMFGLTAALYGNLDVDSGVIRQSNFHDYPILRMNEAPEVEVIIVDSDEPPTGVGEPGLPPAAPAVANAVFAATGQRLRSLPLQLA